MIILSSWMLCLWLFDDVGDRFIDLFIFFVNAKDMEMTVNQIIAQLIVFILATLMAKIKGYRQITA